MRGPRNPSAPEFWEASCGACHAYQLARLRSNLMFTNTGIIRNTQLTWEGMDGRLYAAEGEKVFDAVGRPMELRGVAELGNLAGELYRKFCSQCHVGIATTNVWSAHHDAGCAACHFPFSDSSIYEGGDPTVRGKHPYSATHALQALPDNQACLRCHNRSGRIAHYYQGLNDGNNALVPIRNGFPGPKIASGMRSLTAIAPDVHFVKGMDCIDCHTSRDVMGDGYAYENMYLQTEIACEDCHGGAAELPRFAAIERENEEPTRESASYAERMRPGTEMALTGRGNKYSNVFREAGQVFTLGKRSGVRHETKVITGTPVHTIFGHERLECYACHSRTAAQCYGCHTRYDRTQPAMDYVRGRVTRGSFSETEDYRSLYPFPLAVNQRGKLSTVTPGCQTFVTIADASGIVRDEYVSVFREKRQLRFAPFYSHNTGTRAVGCSECHADPAFLGFGQAVSAGGDLTPTFLCEKADGKPLDGFVTLREGQVKAFSAIVREDSRPLDTNEVRRVWAVNQCLACHGKGDDPIYQAPLDYGKLDECLARPGLPAP
jgi:hypothetical protein